MMHSVLAMMLLAAASGSLRDGPVCALIDPEATPRAALLEAKLLVAPGVTWVDRANLDAVIREQGLQAAFGPQSVADRIRLGRLLKADLLVFVRTRVDPLDLEAEGVPKRSLEVVVSETTGGLRLLVRSVPLTSNPDADVAALQSAVNDGIRKLGERIKTIVAVPPFVNRDLGMEFEHLKGAYAKLAESAALGRNGTLVVELEEARALAKELAVAAPATKIDRPAPVYVLGEFKNEGRGAARRVSLKLTAERNGKVAGREESVIVAPSDVPAALRKWIDSLPDLGTSSPSDAKAELKRLAELAAMHKRLGNADEAVALVEAGLLFDPAHPELLDEAWTLLAGRIFKSMFGRTDEAMQRKLLQDHARALQLFEASIRSGIHPARYDHPLSNPVGRTFGVSLAPLLTGPSAASALRPQVEAAMREQCDVHTRLLPIVVKSGTTIEVGRCIHHAYGSMPLPPDAGIERYASLLLQAQEGPGTIDRMRELCRPVLAIPNRPQDFDEVRRLLDRLERDANPGFKTVIAEQREIVGQFEARRREDQRRQAIFLQKQREVLERRKSDPDHLMPLSLTNPARLVAGLKGTPFRFVPIADVAGRPDPETENLGHVLAAGPGIDIFWSERMGADCGSLFIMKEKGRVKPLCRVPGLMPRYVSVVFDGRYVWASAERVKRNPVVFVIDPVSEVVHDVTTEEGLPIQRTPAELLPPGASNTDHVYAPRIATVSPGKAVIAGSLGRAWIAVATFDPASGARVKVIHEAKEAPEPLDAEQWRRTTAAFAPGSAFTLRDESGGNPRVLLLREHSRMSSAFPNEGIRRAALLVDPIRETVLVIPLHEHWRGPVSGWSSDRDAYLQGRTGASFKDRSQDRLYRVDANGTVRDIGAAPKIGLHTAAIHHDGRTHLVRGGGYRNPIEMAIEPKDRIIPAVPREPSSWWSFDRDGDDMRIEAVDFPETYRLGVSSHYGLIAFLELAGNRAVCTVDFSRNGAEHAASPVPSFTPLRHAEEEKGIRSQNTGTTATVTVANSSGENLVLHWIDLSGKRTSPMPLPDGTKREIQGVLASVWLVTDRYGNAIEVVRATEPNATHVIKPPAKR